MAKWISPVFTDIRNQVGKSVVFSIWKGRGYFRQYVIPANPRTAKQQAHREVFKLLVKRWQEIATSDAIVGAWNTAAQEKLISGYNLFMSEGRKSRISCPSEASGSGSVIVTVTYTLGLPAAVARIYMYDGTNFVDVTPPEGLSPDPNSTIDVEITASGTYEFYIADSRVLVEGDTPPKAYQAITKWEPDETNGVAREAVCSVTVS